MSFLLHLFYLQIQPILFIFTHISFTKLIRSIIVHLPLIISYLSTKLITKNHTQNQNTTKSLQKYDFFSFGLLIKRHTQNKIMKKLSKFRWKEEISRNTKISFTSSQVGASRLEIDFELNIQMIVCINKYR